MFTILTVSDKVIAVIPAYNEESTLIEVIDKVFSYCDNVIVINDSSTDDTQNLLNNYNNKNLITIENKKHLVLVVR